MRRATFLISALFLLIVANVLMMSYASPALTARSEGFVSYMENFAPGRRVATRQRAMSRRTNMVNGGRAGNARRYGRRRGGREHYTNYSGDPAGAGAGYQAMGAFDGVKLETGNNVSSWRYTSPDEPVHGYFPKFEPGQDNLFMFKDNQCKPECCGSSYSCDGGCVCTTPEQRDFINKRGGNRSGLDSGV